MEPDLLGLVLDSSALVVAERRNRTVAQAIESVRRTAGELPVVLSAVSVAEIGHGIYRANTPELRQRRRAFLDELKATVPVHPVTEVTAEIAARVGGEQARLAMARTRACPPVAQPKGAPSGVPGRGAEVGRARMTAGRGPMGTQGA